VAAALAGEVYCGALAAVAEALRRKQPALVVQAEELLGVVDALEARQAQPQVCGCGCGSVCGLTLHDMKPKGRCGCVCV
jgi:hypothetical protein